MQKEKSKSKLLQKVLKKQEFLFIAEELVPKKEEIIWTGVYPREIVW